MSDRTLSLSALSSMAKDSVSAWIDDSASSMGASIAYYATFSIASLLVIVIAIAGYFFGDDAAGGYVYGQLAGFMGDQGARAIEAMVASASPPAQGAIAAVVGTVLLVTAATTVFAEVQSDLDVIWKTPGAAKAQGLWKWIRGRLLTLLLVAGIGFVLVASLMSSAALAALTARWSGAFERHAWLLHAADWVASLAAITLMFALVYKILPSARIAWRDVWIGALATALLFTVGKVLVGLYLGRSGIASGFGAAGSLAALLLWVYYSAQIFLLGAEFTWVYAHRFGSRQAHGARHPAPPPQSVADDTAPTRARHPAVDIVRRHPAICAGAAFVVGAALGRLLENRRDDAD